MIFADSEKPVWCGLSARARNDLKKYAPRHGYAR